MNSFQHIYSLKRIVRHWFTASACAATLVTSPVFADDTMTTSSANTDSKTFTFAYSESLPEPVLSLFEGMELTTAQFPTEELIAGTVDGAIILGQIDDLSMGRMVLEQGERPKSIIVAVWLPSEEQDADADQQSNMQSDNAKNADQNESDAELDEAVLRAAFAGTLDGASVIRLYATDAVMVQLADQQWAPTVIEYAAAEDDDANNSADDSEKTEEEVAREAELAAQGAREVATQSNRADTVRSEDGGYLVLPPEVVRRANAVQLGLREAAFPGGYR